VGFCSARSFGQQPTSIACRKDLTPVALRQNSSEPNRRAACRADGELPVGGVRERLCQERGPGVLPPLP